ncbi:YcdB/YcdC domain-containing protein, partial [Clostridium paraputrificum]
MNYKKRSIIFFITIICLLISILCIVYSYIGGGSKEIRAAKRFVGLLYSEDIVAETENFKNISYESLKKYDMNNESEYYIVNTRDFGIDVDNEFKVIGFKNKVCILGETKISEEQAVKKAEDYLDKIYKGDVEFKEFIKSEGQEVPYYSLIFTKLEDGYPFYKDQIIVNIDKEKGTLDGYSNISTLKEPGRVKIKVTQDKAEETALNEALSLVEKSEIVGETFKAFYEDKDRKKTEL